MAKNDEKKNAPQDGKTPLQIIMTDKKPGRKTVHNGDENTELAVPLDKRPVGNLSQIPEELLFAVFLLLTPVELGAIAQTCKMLYRISHDQVLWKNHFFNDFPETARRTNNISSTTYLENYQNTYKNEYQSINGKNQISKAAFNRQLKLRKTLHYYSVSEFKDLSETLALEFNDLISTLNETFTKNLLDFAEYVGRQDILDYLFEIIKSSEENTLQKPSDLTLSGCAILCRQSIDVLNTNELIANSILKLPSGETHSHLSLAISCEHLKVVKYILEENNNALNTSIEIDEKINSKKPFILNIRSAIGLAAYTGNVELVDALLKGGAYIDDTSSYLENQQAVCTPFLIACICGHSKLAKILLEKGAQIQNRTAAYYAARNGFINILQLLENNGFLIEAKQLIKVAKKFQQEETFFYLLKRREQNSLTSKEIFKSKLKLRTTFENASNFLGKLCGFKPLGTAVALYALPFILISACRKAANENIKDADPKIVREFVLQNYPDSRITEMKKILSVSKRNPTLLDCLDALDKACEICKEAGGPEQVKKHLLEARVHDKILYQKLLFKLFALSENIITIQEKEMLAHAAGYSSLASVLPDTMQCLTSSLLMLHNSVMHLFVEQPNTDNKKLTSNFKVLKNHLCELLVKLDSIQSDVITDSNEFESLKKRFKDIKNLVSEIKNEIKDTEILRESYNDFATNFSHITWLADLCKEGYDITQAALTVTTSTLPHN